MEHGQAQELLEAYALEALAPEEREAVARHIEGCAECRRMAAAYAEALSRLPEAVVAASSVQPPAPLKEQVLEAARTLAASRPAPGTTASPGRRARRWRWALAGSAAGLLLAASLGWGIQSTVALVRERNLRSDLESVVGQQETVLEVVDSPKTARSVLRATAPGSSAYGKVFVNADLPQVVAMAARLGKPPEGQAYHLWLFQQGRPVLAGVLAVNDQGFGLLVYDALTKGPIYDAALVTLQPDGASAPANPVLQWQRPPLTGASLRGSNQRPSQ